jgi:DNA-directed RNA polymerase specialized sigma24 family protein
VCTPSAQRRPHPGVDVRPELSLAAPPSSAPSVSARGFADPAEQVALVARAKRGALLRAHRHRLRDEDLEECFSQATLELLAAVRAGRRLSGAAHLANALEQRFLSRIRDRRRAVGGRSPLQAALEDALPLGGFGEREVELSDPRADVHQLVVRRIDLERLLAVASDLSSDQRLVLRHQVCGGSRAEFCQCYGWSFEKYRKVAQRGRARLRALMESESRGSDGGGSPLRVVTPLAPAMSPLGDVGRSRD